MSLSPNDEVARKKPKLNVQITGILDLPNEIIQKIFTYLWRDDLHGNVALVCRRFLEISRLAKQNVAKL